MNSLKRKHVALPESMYTDHDLPDKCSKQIKGHAQNVKENSDAALKLELKQDGYQEKMKISDAMMQDQMLVGDTGENIYDRASPRLYTTQIQRSDAEDIQVFSVDVYQTVAGCEHVVIKNEMQEFDELTESAGHEQVVIKKEMQDFEELTESASHKQVVIKDEMQEFDELTESAGHEQAVIKNKMQELVGIGNLNDREIGVKIETICQKTKDVDQVELDKQIRLKRHNEVENVSSGCEQGVNLDVNVNDVDSTLQLTCPIKGCGKKFPNMKEMQKHHMSEHKSITCSHCEHVCSTFRMYIAHKATHSQHLGNIRFDETTNQFYTAALNGPVMCDICHEEVGTEQRLEHHMRRCHCKGLHYYYKCIWCPKVFNCESDLQIHATKVLNQFLNSCTKCNKCFFNLAEADQHNHTHQLCYHKYVFVNDGTTFTCPLCNLLFSAQDILKLHKKIIDHALKDCICRTCQMICKTKKARIAHEASHLSWLNTSSGKIIVKSDGKREIQLRSTQKCSKCKLIFPSSEALDNHNLTHPEWMKHGGTFRCHWCSKMFNSQRALLIHVSKVLSRFLKPCAVCNREDNTIPSADLYHTKCDVTTETCCQTCNMYLTDAVCLEVHKMFTHGIIQTGGQEENTNIEMTETRQCDTSKENHVNDDKVNSSEMQQTESGIPNWQNEKDCDDNEEVEQPLCQDQVSKAGHSSDLVIKVEPSLSHESSARDRATDAFLLESKGHLDLGIAGEDFPQVAKTVALFQEETINKTKVFIPDRELLARSSKEDEGSNAAVNSSQLVCKTCQLVCNTKKARIAHETSHLSWLNTSRGKIIVKSDGTHEIKLLITSLTCCYCKLIFPSSQALVNHKLTHPEWMKYRGRFCCQWCSKMFNSQRALLIHVSKVLSRFLKPCAVCGREDLSHTVLFADICHTMCDKKTEAYCRTCNMYFADACSLKVHKRQTHGIIRTAKTSKTKVSKPGKELLTSANKDAGSNVPGQHICKICKTEFIQLSFLLNHEMVSAYMGECY